MRTAQQGRARPAMVSSSDQVTPPGITAVGGPITSFTGKVWVIDSGIDLDHPDLNVDVANSVNFAPGSGPNDTNGHGTHVAGTIAAIDNDFGVVGVVPGAEVVAVRTFGRIGLGLTSNVIAGVDYVAANAGANDVINMSLGGGVSEALDDAVLFASFKPLKFAIAAGNSELDASDFSPARVNGPNIYTISAVDDNKVFASFSNFGNPPIECAAPGVAVLSTFRDGGYATLNGTSMATPHVAGLILAQGAPSFGAPVFGDPDGNPDPFCEK